MKPREFQDEGYNIGQYIQLYRRIQRQLDKRAEVGHDVRVNVGNKVVELTPTWENANIEPGTAAGAIVAAVASYAKEYVPVGSEAEITDSEPIEGGTRYTVNVDAPLEQQAQFQAMMEAGTGFTSLIADQFEVSEPEVLRQRTTRDTWQYEVVVKEPEVEEDIDSFGLGILDINDHGH